MPHLVLCGRQVTSVIRNATRSECRRLPLSPCISKGQLRLRLRDNVDRRPRPWGSVKPPQASTAPRGGGCPAARGPHQPAQLPGVGGARLLGHAQTFGGGGQGLQYHPGVTWRPWAGQWCSLCTPAAGDIGDVWRGSRFVPTDWPGRSSPSSRSVKCREGSEKPSLWLWDRPFCLSVSGRPSRLGGRQPAHAL